MPPTLDTRPRRAALARNSLLLALAALWVAALSRFPPHPALALACGLSVAGALCKALTIRPLWRPLATILPFAVVGPFAETGISWPMAQGAAIGAAGYAAFTLARRAHYALLRHGIYSPAGKRIAFDRAILLLLRERWRQRLLPVAPLRILLSPSAHEPGIRAGFANTPHRIEFGDPWAGDVHECDLFIPLTIPSLLQAGTSLPPGRLAWPIPTAECIALCDDKLSFHRHMAAKGFNAFLPAIAGAGEFPSVLKKRIDEWGANCHLLRGPDDEMLHAHLLADPAFFRQHYVEGDVEFASHLLVSGGRITRALTIEYRFDAAFHLKGVQAPPDRKRVARNAHLGVFEAMLAALSFEGLCCVNYKRHGGRPLVMEINPRFGASLAPYLFCFVDRAVRAGIRRPAPDARRSGGIGTLGSR